MFGWLKPDPVKALRRQYEAKMKQAMELQRSGDIQTFAEVHTEAQAILAKLEAAEQAR